ncbi:hypothetical protein Tcan_14167 [Toxocara canis]|uniref:TIL domain-containing protein n=1 Tax=Toxocara canis TaxID=6265 RepID=A0A0B2V1B9_TOXCA|nr:hypothetical protein Tcan_14167 [Toxocara canis]
MIKVDLTRIRTSHVKGWMVAGNMVIVLIINAVVESCIIDADCNGLKCVGNRCISTKPCFTPQASAAPKGCYYELQQNDDGCRIPTLKCDQKKVQKRETVQCPRNAVWSNCTNLCGYPHCATMNLERYCHSLRCGPPGCICKEGHVFISADHSLGCVPKEECSKIVH